MTASHPAAAHAPAHLAEIRGATSISVCIPARDEEATVGAVVAAIRRDLVDGVALVDEILVMDDGSTDATAAVAAAAGATVVAVAGVLPSLGARAGKGEALWTSLAASHGDLVVWVDADLEGFTARTVSRLVAPLLLDPSVALVKGFYRPDGAGGAESGSGRVTELVARPVISSFHPELAGIVQPLGGECAGRRDVLEAVPFAGGYGVDLGLLIDVGRREGPDAVAQVGLGERRHRHHPLDRLGVQAAEVLDVALRRAGVRSESQPVLRRPDRPDARVDTSDRPPLGSLRGTVPGLPPRPGSPPAEVAATLALTRDGRAS